ncbi:MAG: TonB-dependent receptor plug domain-containing protein [Deltaproteobacteria bacterium]|nr:TonB-dependent receptor plug domain-containing protein [Deltaproteobacteria bacterium]
MLKIHRILAVGMTVVFGAWFTTAEAQPAPTSQPTATSTTPTPTPPAPAPAPAPEPAPAATPAPPTTPAPIAGGIIIEEDAPTADLEEEEEEEIVVISASKTAQTIEEAPSIVSVVPRRELLLQGYQTLGEVLRNTVGFGINDNGHWADTGVRGINGRTTYGDKIQFLIDGHNMSWRQFNRNFHNPTWVDMGDIERIEIIRGPGAALWGSNALTGVVNIVTRDWTKLKGAEVSYSADHRLASQAISARMGKEFGEVKLYASVSFYQEDNDSILAPVKEFEVLPGVVSQEPLRHQRAHVHLQRYRWRRQPLRHRPPHLPRLL